MNATDFRGAPATQPLRSKWQIDASVLQVDVWPRGAVDFADFAITLGTCIMHSRSSGISRTVPPPGGGSGPPTIEHGRAYGSMLHDATWGAFHFVSGARYVIEAKAGAVVIARFAFQVPSDFLSLSSASRTSLTWQPVPASNAPAFVTAARVTADEAFSTMAPSVRLALPTGVATWNAADPTVTHAYLSWGRSIVVDGMKGVQTLTNAWLEPIP
jgi:hypothetical protein